ncbi:MAG: hypothetical protein OXI82_03180 [Nitrospinae bacterium]|nr:hypothetical protein [Nitrospinota bacterium]
MRIAIIAAAVVLFALAAPRAWSAAPGDECMVMGDTIAVNSFTKKNINPAFNLVGLLVAIQLHAVKHKKSLPENVASIWKNGTIIRIPKGFRFTATDVIKKSGGKFGSYALFMFKRRNGGNFVIANIDLLSEVSCF